MVSVSFVLNYIEYFELSLYEQSGRNEDKMAIGYCTPVRLALFREAFGQQMSLADHKNTQRGTLGAFSVFVVKLCGFCLSIVYITHPCHPYIDPTDSDDSTHRAPPPICLVIEYS